MEQLGLMFVIVIGVLLLIGVGFLMGCFFAVAQRPRTEAFVEALGAHIQARRRELRIDGAAGQYLGTMGRVVVDARYDELFLIEQRLLASEEWRTVQAS